MSKTGPKIKTDHKFVDIKIDYDTYCDGLTELMDLSKCNSCNIYYYYKDMKNEKIANNTIYTCIQCQTDDMYKGG
jgi:hypothetical protein